MQQYVQKSSTKTFPFSSLPAHLSMIEAQKVAAEQDASRQSHIDQLIAFTQLIAAFGIEPMLCRHTAGKL